MELHGAVERVALGAEELRGGDGDAVGAGVLDLDLAGPGATAHDVGTAGDEAEGIAMDGGGGEAEDEVFGACGPLLGGGRGFLGWENVVGDAGGDLAVGLEVAGGNDEAFAEVVEAVEFGIAGSPRLAGSAAMAV